MKKEVKISLMQSILDVKTGIAFEQALLTNDEVKSAKEKADINYQKLNAFLNEEGRELLSQFNQAKDDMVTTYGRSCYAQGGKDFLTLAIDCFDDE